MVGYAAVYFRSEASWAWPLLVAIGMIGSFLIGWFSRVGHADPSVGWRYGLTVLALFLFFLALFSIIKPRSGAAVAAVVPIFVTLYYAVEGIWRSGARMLLLGAAVGALTIGGYFWLTEYFLLWIAMVGGGALILGGLWLGRI